MDCYGNILHEKGLSNSTQFLMEGISCVTPRKRLYLTNRFQVAVLLCSNRSQMNSKCGKNILFYIIKNLKSVNDDVIYTSVLQ